MNWSKQYRFIHISLGASVEVLSIAKLHTALVFVFVTSTYDTEVLRFCVSDGLYTNDGW